MRSLGVPPMETPFHFMVSADLLCTTEQLRKGATAAEKT